MSENDIVPELLEKIMNDFEENVSLIRAEETFEALLKSNNLEDAYETAREIGGALSESFSKFITEDILPNGRMYYNIANRIIPPTLQKAYKEAEEITEIIMSNILSKSKIGIKVQKGLLNQDRIRGIVDRLSEAENYQDVKFLTGKAVVQNVTQSAVDDTIEANAQFHYKSGLRAVVERKLGGKCCAWCRNLVGRYTYPNVPDDVYRRHENCRCTVTYYPSKASKGQDVWSKRTVDASKLSEASSQDKQLENVSKKSKIGANSSGFYDDVYYDPDNDYSINIKGLNPEVNNNLSKAAESVAQLGSQDRNEHMYLVDLSGQLDSYYETNGLPSEVGYDFWDFVDNNKNSKFAFVHNHVTSSPLSQVDLETPLRCENIPIQIAVRCDGVKYIAKRAKMPSQNFIADEYFEKELEHINKMSRENKITAAERMMMREKTLSECIVDEFYEGVDVINGRKK